MTRFGQTMLDIEIERRYALSETLKRLEENRAAMPALQLIRSVKDLEAKLRAGPQWTDSQGKIGSAFLNLVRDEETNRPYLAYHDITRRLQSLKAYAASRLTPLQAQAEGVSQFQRLVQTSDAEADVARGIRLHRPGGMAFETARELPEPFTEEAVRRGGQAKRVGQEILTELQPIAERQRQELERRELANTVLVATSLGLLIFMKNKLLAGLAVAGLVYFFKKDAVEELQRDVQELKGDIQNVRETLT